ncbi:putative ATP-dependent DNA helicase RecQ [Kineosphaera limosa NBRC 100340]|uniref:DNA 3'-5' helicase n=1 Tax=Kineosphaera limosa NBRC 100340 TaxID=1184609 RepID=K6VJV0_9MICO|nr:putative ATP-dependent DNA helicase RecQ [Kineosphaera limosa NBRC 100340]
MRLDRRGQRYGAGHLVDILLGKRTARVEQLGHSDLSTFGIGTECSEPEWRGVVRQLLAGGLLAVQGEYGTLGLTQASGAVLRGERQIMLRRELPKARRAGGGSRAGGSSGGPSGSGGSKAAADLDPQSAAVFESLRAWRAATAKEQGVPAYVVFHDATLRGIAAAAPTTLDELSAISGVGAAKLERYGPGVLATLTSDAAETAQAGPGG